MLKEWNEVEKSYREQLNERVKEIFEEFSDMENGLFELSIFAAKLELLREHDAVEHIKDMDDYEDRIKRMLKHVDTR